MDSWQSFYIGVLGGVIFTWCATLPVYVERDALRETIQTMQQEIRQFQIDERGIHINWSGGPDAMRLG